MIDNIVYCDKYRQKAELAKAIRSSVQQVKQLGAQETEEFKSWIKNILLAICKNKESVVMEILNWAEKGEEDVGLSRRRLRIWRRRQLGSVCFMT